MPRASFAKHFTGTGVQGSVKREGAMPVVLESMTLGTSRGKRQHWIKPVKGLNGALFVYTEHRGVDGRLQIQPNNVGCLLFELRVVTGHIAPQPMGLNAVLPPDPINASRTNTQMFCQPVAAPMGSSIGRSLARRCQDFSLSLCRTYSPLTTPITRIQTAQPPLLKTFLPHTDIAISAVQAPTNLRTTISLGEYKNQLSPLAIFCFQGPTPRPALQFAPLRRCQYYPAYCHPSIFAYNCYTSHGNTALVLAIGIVVDDAIVVVENVERWIEHGLDPKEATRKAMDEVGGAVISIAVVLTAVFVPTALVSGISGQFYRQFALTIAIATLISAFNSLTLSPALACLLIKPGHAKKDLITKLINALLGWFFRLFNRTFDWGINSYGAVIRRLLRVSGVVLIIYVGLLALTGLVFQKVPSGFIPTMDQGYLIVFAQLPDGASLQRNDEVRRQIGEIAKNMRGVELTFAVEGLSILDSTTKSNALTVFFPLKPFSERIGHQEQSATAIVAKLQTAFSSIQDAFVIAIRPPSVRGMGNAGGFQLEIEDRRNAGLNALQQATDAVTNAANAEPGLSGVFTTYRSQVPQLFLNLDRETLETLNVPISSVFTALQSYLGSNYVNDFNFLGRTYQVNLQGDASFRSDPNQILRMYARNSTGGMVPLGSLMDVQRINGPDSVSHYNVYPAALIQGATLPGVSSGQAIEKMERICRENLPSQFSFEW